MTPPAPLKTHSTHKAQASGDTVEVPYARLAQACAGAPAALASVDFGRLRAEWAYLEKDAHVRSGALALVHVERRRSAEDDPAFGSGCCGRAAASVEATTHWLVGGKRFAVTCQATYSFTLETGRGVVAVSGMPDEPVGEPGSVVCSRREREIVLQVGRLSVASKHARHFRELCDRGPAVPQKFLERVRAALGPGGSPPSPDAAFRRRWDDWAQPRGDQMALPVLPAPSARAAAPAARTAAPAAPSMAELDALLDSLL